MATFSGGETVASVSSGAQAGGGGYATIYTCPAGRYARVSLTVPAAIGVTSSEYKVGGSDPVIIFEPSTGNNFNGTTVEFYLAAGQVVAIKNSVGAIFSYTSLEYFAP